MINTSGIPFVDSNITRHKGKHDHRRGNTHCPWLKVSYHSRRHCEKGPPLFSDSHPSGRPDLKSQHERPILDIITEIKIHGFSKRLDGILYSVDWPHLPDSLSG